MIKTTTSILLLTASTLCAEETDLLESNELLANCTICCEPYCTCCVPKPIKCIDCEAYSPQFYDLQCDWGLFIDVEFLYWYANEQYLPIAMRERVTDVFDDNATLIRYALPEREETMKPQWDPGVRVGLGGNSECDGWDWLLIWTYVYNKNKRSKSVAQFEDDVISNLSDGTEILFSPWASLNLTFNQPYDAVKARWRLSYNVLDLEVGRKYWTGECFSIRPFIGVKGSWQTIRFDVASKGDFVQIPQIEDDVEFKNRIWGIGIMGGVQPTWYFTRCFSLYGSFDIALLWGRDNMRRSETLLVCDLPVDVTQLVDGYTLKDQRNGMQAVLDLGIGLSYGDTFCCDRFRFGVDFGWEHHRWFTHVHKIGLSQARRVSGSDEFPLIKDSFIDIENDLGLGGFVLRLRLDF